MKKRRRRQTPERIVKKLRDAGETLKREPAQTGNGSCHFASFRLKLSFARPGSRVEPIRRAFVPLRPTELVGFSIKQVTQGLFLGRANEFIEVAPNRVTVDLDDTPDLFPAWFIWYFRHQSVRGSGGG